MAITKINLIYLITLVIIFTGSINSLAEARQEDSEDLTQRINVEVDSPSIIRNGNETIFIIRIQNLDENNNSELIVRDIKIFDSNKKIIKISDSNKEVYSMKKELDYIEKQIKKGKYGEEDTPELKEAIFGIKDKEFKERFVLNLNDFKSPLEIGDKIDIFLKIKITYERKNYILERNHTILISPLLPSPSHNSPGWYKGDQHVHSSYSDNWVDYLPIIGHNGWCNSISDQVDTAKSLDYDWVIFTEHSFADDADTSAEWNSGKTECDNEDTSSFKCHYGLELSTDAPGVCDTSHYLYYDSTPLFIEADCNSLSGYTCCDVEAEDLIDEVNTNGGIGFIAHPYGTVFGGYCYGDSLSESNIISAIENGNCVASTGPFVQFILDGEIIGNSVDVSSGTNNLDISANSEGFGDITYIYVYLNDEYYGDIEVFDDTYSGTLDINLDSSDKFIRLEVYTTTGYRAYTNPIWVDVTTCSCGSWSEGSCGAGSCSSSQKQWTRKCTPSACAAETKCVYDEDCEDEGGDVTECEESGYEYCIESEYGDCTVSIAENLYDNVNNIQWGGVNDAWDPYVIDEYVIGWKAVDAEQMYYNCDGDTDCEYGGCDCTEINDEDTMVTVSAPGTAHREEILGYDDTESYACWVWWYPFYPNYENNPYIYVLNCYDDVDC